MRRRLLFLSQTLPYPPDGGVKIRTYHVFRHLAASFDVHALCFYRWKGGRIDSDPAASARVLGRFAKVELFQIPQEKSRRRLLSDHLSSLVRRRVYTVPTYRSHSFRSRLQRLLAGTSFDLVHADSLDLSGYFDLLCGLPLVCVHHDVQSVLLRRRANVEESPWRRVYMKIQSRLMEREERRWCPIVDLNVTVSDRDRQTLKRIAGGGQYAVVPNGVDTDFFKPSDGSTTGAVFVGGSTWHPNRDALAYFAARILPRIRERDPETEVLWVGRAFPEEHEHYGNLPGLTLTGYVDDIRPYVERASCYVVPLRVGGGTRIKILDAWAMGKAVVSTSIGCEGLEARDGVNILIRDSADAFAEAVAQVLENRRLREDLGRAGRETVKRLYSWSVIGPQMIELYHGFRTRNERQ